jgi:hypothetical protein
MANEILSKHRFSPKNGIRIFILLLSGSILLTATSCKWFGGSSKPSCEVKFFYLKYSKTEIEKWLTPGKKTSGFVLQFYSTDGGKCDTAFGAISYPLDSTNAYYMPPDTLGIQRDSTTKTFNNKIILGNNWISRSSIDKIFVKPDGTARDFDYVLLVPKLDKGGTRHVVYELKVFKGTTEIPDVFLGGDESKPSPPAPPAT